MGKEFKDEATTSGSIVFGTQPDVMETVAANHPLHMAAILR
jgi:hypothetical protein